MSTPRIPLPTDNIYKFYALAGLLLLFFSITAYVFTLDKAEQVIHETNVATITLASKSPPTQIDRQIHADQVSRMLQAVENARRTTYFLGFITFVSVVAFVFGMGQWHRIIQPKQDRLIDLQIAKLEKDIEVTESNNNLLALQFKKMEDEALVSVQLLRTQAQKAEDERLDSLNLLRAQIRKLEADLNGAPDNALLLKLQVQKAEQDLKKPGRVPFRRTA